MKKLFAVLAALAMVTTAAHAQAAVAGTLETRLNSFRGNLSADDVELEMGGSIGTAWLQFSGTNADGTLGALWRFRQNDMVRGPGGGVTGPVWHRAFVWWRPIEQMRIMLGIDSDGQFDTSSIAGWGFHQGDNDFMFNHQWDFWRRVFPGNWDSFGLAFSFINLVDGLNLNLVLPTGSRTWPREGPARVTETRNLDELIAGFRLHGTFAIPGAGTLQLTYNAPGGIMNDTPGQVDRTTWEDATTFGQVGLSFLLTALDFGNLLFGGAVVIPDSDGDLDAHAGLGLDMPALVPGLMGLRFRAGMRIPTADGVDPLLTANLMPVVSLGPGSLMFDIGVTARFADEFDAEADLGWSVKPVYRLPLASGAFSIGLHVWSGTNMGGNQTDLTGNNDIHINIPMLLRFSF